MPNKPNLLAIQVHHGDTEITEKYATLCTHTGYNSSSVSSVSRWWINRPPAGTQAFGRPAAPKEANWGNWGFPSGGNRACQTNPIRRKQGDCFAALAMTVVEPNVARGEDSKRTQFARVLTAPGNPKYEARNANDRNKPACVKQSQFARALADPGNSKSETLNPKPIQRPKDGNRNVKQTQFDGRVAPNEPNFSLSGAENDCRAEKRSQSARPVAPNKANLDARGAKNGGILCETKPISRLAAFSVVRRGDRRKCVNLVPARRMMPVSPWRRNGCAAGA